MLHGLRGSTVETVTLGELVRQLETYFADAACMIDQAFQPRLAAGMIRCYLAQDRVVGFGHQMVTALLAPMEAGANGPHRLDALVAATIDSSCDIPPREAARLLRSQLAKQSQGAGERPVVTQRQDRHCQEFAGAERR